MWAAIAFTAIFVRADWRVLKPAARGAAFLLALVLCAAMMPVEALPNASGPLTFGIGIGIGIVSAAFDNIP